MWVPSGIFITMALKNFSHFVIATAIARERSKT